MRRVVKITISLSLLWSVLWLGSAYALKGVYWAWFTEQEARGWQVDFADHRVQGYPLRHVTTLSLPVFADPFNGTAWSAEYLTLTSPAYWPGDVTVTFPNGPQRLSYYDQTSVLSAQSMTAELDLKPTLDLQLHTLSLVSGPWTIMSEDGTRIGADGLTLSMVQSETDPATYDFTATAPQFSPSETMVLLASTADELPDTFESLQMTAQVTFADPWDINALSNRRPQPRHIDLQLAEAHWGDMVFRMAGRMDVDENGILDGTVSLRAENWQSALQIAHDAGHLPAPIHSTLETGLSMIARLSGDPERIEMDLTLRDGMVNLGPLPLGPAPRIILR